MFKAFFYQLTLKAVAAEAAESDRIRDVNERLGWRQHFGHFSHHWWPPEQSAVPNETRIN